MMKIKKLMMVVLVSFILVFLGCGVMSIVIKKCNFEVKIQMSEIIWFEFVSECMVFLQIKNMFDKDMSGLQGKIVDVVKVKGYQVVIFLDKVYYWIQVNVLKVDKMDLWEFQGWLNCGYEGVVVGVVLGVGIIGYNFNFVGVIFGVGFVVGLVGMVVDVMVEDVNYIMIMDVQIVECIKVMVIMDNVVVLCQGILGVKIQISIEIGNQYKYQICVVLNVNKVNLKFEEVKFVFEDQLVKLIVNIF